MRGLQGPIEAIPMSPGWAALWEMRENRLGEFRRVEVDIPQRPAAAAPSAAFDMQSFASTLPEVPIPPCSTVQKHVIAFMHLCVALIHHPATRSDRNSSPGFSLVMG